MIVMRLVPDRTWSPHILGDLIAIKCWSRQPLVWWLIRLRCHLWWDWLGQGHITVNYSVPPSKKQMTFPRLGPRRLVYLSRDLVDAEVSFKYGTWQLSNECKDTHSMRRKSGLFCDLVPKNARNQNKRGVLLMKGRIIWRVKEHTS